MIRKLLFFAGAAAVSLLAARWRWPDSAHAIGAIRAGGGTARHGVAFRAGPSSYQLVATATVLPPWSGDARISVEGDPPLGWSAALSRPAVDLGVHDFPRLEGDVIRGLRPRHRIALWVDLHPGASSSAPPGEYRLALRDARTGGSLLAIPIAFGAEGGGDHAGHP
jgi:hypothetical protein